MPPPVVETLDLCKDYHVGPETIHALRGITVKIERGEFVAVMGRSGSGKSTFMHLLGCLDTLTSGQYFFNGQRITGTNRDQLAELRNDKIGFVFQTFNLLSRASALQNVALPLLYAKGRKADRMERARSVLETVGLADRADHTPAQLSGGQQQRVAIARSLVNGPDLILADEPTGALDTATSEEIMAVFQSLNDYGITVIIVTHEQEVAAYTKRMLTFRDGMLTNDVPNKHQIRARGALDANPMIEVDAAQ